VQKYTSVTAASTTLFSQATFGFPASFGGLVYFKLTNSGGGGTLTFSWSLDGITYHQVASESVGTFITPTDYGVGGVCQSAGAGDFMTISLQSVVV
jgi:hypothetical protein